MIFGEHSRGRLREIMQTYHSIEMKNQDLSNKKSGLGGKIKIMVK